MVKVASQVKQDGELPTDVRTAKVLQQIANGICEYGPMQVATDCPSMHKNGRLSILDLELEMSNNIMHYRHDRRV